jgi:hypothetical protein
MAFYAFLWAAYACSMRAKFRFWGKYTAICRRFSVLENRARYSVRFARLQRETQKWNRRSQGQFTQSREVAKPAKKGTVNHTPKISINYSAGSAALREIYIPTGLAQFRQVLLQTERVSTPF